jgi:hypothetical protein
MEAASFRRTLFLTRVPKGIGRFLMRRLASFIYFEFQKKKYDPSNGANKGTDRAFSLATTIGEVQHAEVRSTATKTYFA